MVIGFYQNPTQIPGTYPANAQQPYTFNARTPFTYNASYRVPFTYNARTPFTYNARYPAGYPASYRVPFTYNARYPGYILQHIDIHLHIKQTIRFHILQMQDNLQDM